jgi:hypothetical protein
MSCLAPLELANTGPESLLSGGVKGWFKTCFSQSVVDWKRFSTVALWVLALIVPGGLVMLALYGTVRAARSRMLVGGTPVGGTPLEALAGVTEVVRQSVLPPPASAA